MKKNTITLLIIISLTTATLLTGCVSPNNQQNETPEKTQTELALEFMNLILEQKLTEAYTYFSTEMTNQFSMQQFELTWTTIETTYGIFLSIGPTSESTEEGYDIVFVNCTFANNYIIIFKLVFDQDKKISGFWTEKIEPITAYTPLDYVNTSKFEEFNVTIGTDPWALPSTLTIPTNTGPFPVVILVHGSGPNDQDETVGANKPFKDLAWGLASQGIAVLRYEKRTKHYATTIVDLLFELTVEEETIEDALHAITLLKNTSAINASQIYLIGHSLGGMLAPRIATQTNDLAGIILMAAPTRPLEDLMINQTIYLAELDGTVTTDEQTQIDVIQENVTKIKTLNIGQNEIILGASLAYWEDLATYSPINTALTLDIPILILQGTRDYQVPFDIDYTNWQTTFSTNTDVTFHLYENLNHLFISGTGDPTFTEYYTPGNIHESVINDITNWIKNP